ncbi:MAG: ankyrin repeat domain-containing protein [Candidatus Endonucleobacter sp. (ex Gigantidas childressi)]|nr:ankyrin repeat domain-containing protein [Candidatus Endonucleobacter sp. (ex Gigantidas childressi)]
MVSELYRCIGSLYTFVRCVFFSCLLIFSCCTKGAQEQSIDEGVLLEEMIDLERTGKWLFKEMHQELVPRHRKNDRFLLIIDSAFVTRNLPSVNSELYLEGDDNLGLDSRSGLDLYLGRGSGLGVDIEVGVGNYLVLCLMCMLEAGFSKSIFVQNVSPNNMSSKILGLSEKIDACDCPLLEVNADEFFVDDALKRGLSNYSAVVRLTWYEINKINKIKCSIQNITRVSSNNQPELKIQEVDTSPCLPEETFVLPPSKVGVGCVESLAEPVMLNKMDKTHFSKHNKRKSGRILIAVNLSGIDEVKFLLSQGADVSGRNSSPSPLWTAVDSGQIDIVNVLLERGADPNINYGKMEIYDPLILAIRKRYYNIFKSLIDHGYNINKEYTVDIYKSFIVSPLLVSLRKNLFDFTAYLVAKNVNISTDEECENDPLCISLESSDELFDLILSTVADGSLVLNAALSWCLRESKNHVYIKKLLDKGADANLDYHLKVRRTFNQGPENLRLALGKNNSNCYDLVNLLLSFGANPNVHDPDRYIKYYAPLYKAVKDECAKTARLLVTNGAEVGSDIDNKYCDLLKKNDLEDPRKSPFTLKTLTFTSINCTLGSFTCSVERKKAIEKLKIPEDCKTILYNGYHFDDNKGDNAAFHSIIMDSSTKLQ